MASEICCKLSVTTKVTLPGRVSLVLAGEMMDCLLPGFLTDGDDDGYGDGHGHGHGYGHG